ncbi:cobalamin B12-binding domain-containing protein [archaeon]|nr:cobalamin B12-binding domain-containing protein [archaeon]
MGTTDVLFLLPPTSLYERYGKFASGGNKAAPMGICILASVIMKYGLKCRIIDSEVERLDFNKIISRINALSPRYVCMSANTITINSANKIIAYLKEKKPHTQIILGGPHITAAPVETFEKYPLLDIAVIGESEETLLELIKAKEEKKSYKKIKGIIYRDNKKIVLTEKRELIKDLNKLPFPSWNLLPNIAKNYEPPLFSFQNKPSCSLVTSRGCPGQCIFCVKNIFGFKFRSYNSSYMVGMVEYLIKKYDMKDFLFDDDIFTCSKIRVKNFSEKLIKKNIDVSWSCNTRADAVDEDLLRIMSKSGCWQISYGIESGSQRVLDALKKKTTPKKIRDALHWTKKAGIKTKGFLMVGNPLESKQTLNETLNLILTSELDDMQFTFFTPLPGTESFNKIELYGTLENDWSKMSMWNPVFIPKNTTKKELQEFQRKAIIKFYLRPKIIIRYIELLIKKPESFRKLFLGFRLVVRITLKI